MPSREVTTPPPVTEPALPGVGEPGVGEAPDVLSEEERKRKRRKARLVLAILLIVAAIVVILIFRACTGRPPIPGLLAPQLPHYASSIYGTSRPVGVAVSPSGERVYVTESDGRRLVRVFNSSGNQVDVLKPRGHTGQWRSPVYVAVDPLTDDVYVSDRLRATVDIYTATGAYRGTFRPLAKKLHRRKSRTIVKWHRMRGLAPLGLAFDRQGNLYMTNVRGRFHQVLIFGRDRKLIRKLGNRRQFSFPNAVAIDGRADLYVSDSNHGRLAIFDPNGKAVASIRRGVGEGDLGLPRGVAIDGDGRLYVVDATSHIVKVYRIDSKGEKVPGYIGSFGQEGRRNGMFEYPNAVAVDGRGWIYVTDRENGRVQIWRR